MDSSKIRTYNLLLKASLTPTSFQTAPLKLILSDFCSTADPVAQVTEPQKYVIGDAPLAFSLVPWLDSGGANQCGVILYSAKVNGREIDKNWGVFDS